MMNRLFCGLIALALMLCGLAMAEEKPLAEGADSDWYMAVLTDEAIAKQYPYHAFVDVNGDGVPVLIVSTTEDSFISGEDGARVYVYAGGEARPVMEVGYSGGEIFYCNAEEHTLTYFYRFSGEGHIEVYHVKDGGLELVLKADRYGPFHGPEGDNTEEIYFRDGEPIDEAACEALCEQYTSEKDAVTYEKLQ